MALERSAPQMVCNLGSLSGEEWVKSTIAGPGGNFQIWFWLSEYVLMCAFVSCDGKFIGVLSSTHGGMFPHLPVLLVLLVHWPFALGRQDRNDVLCKERLSPRALSSSLPLILWFSS